jgi:opacity protein-like surface antigen
MKKYLVLSVFCAMGVSAMAEEAGINYNEATLNYAGYKTSSTTYNGYAFDLGLMLTENIYTLGKYQSFDSGNINQGSLGLGYRIPAGGGADGFFTLKYETDTEAVTTNGYSLGAGVRAKVTGDMDIIGAYSYRMMGKTHDYTFDAGLSYKFTSNMFGNLGYATTSGDSSTSIYTLGVGFSF